jgi:hypothetical protein
MIKYVYQAKTNPSYLLGSTDLQLSHVVVLQVLDKALGSLKSFPESSLPGHQDKSVFHRFCFLNLTNLDRVATSTVDGADHTEPVEQDVPDIFGRVISVNTSEVVKGNNDFFSGFDVSLGKGDCDSEIAAVNLFRVRIARVTEVHCPAFVLTQFRVNFSPAVPARGFRSFNFG